MDIVFGHPNLLYALWGLVPLLFVLLHARRKQRRASAQLLDATMEARLMPRLIGWRSIAPIVLTLLAFGSLVFAAARPRFGVQYEQVARRGADIVVLLDVSRSMLSDDVYPNRLERARSYIRDLLARLTGDRVALVAFAGRAVDACPLTIDHAFFDRVLESVGPDTAPRGGTAIGDAIRVGLETLDDFENRDRAFVLITDGEDHDSFPLEAAAVAAERGVKVFTVGIGDPAEGARIPQTDDGGLTYLKYEGQEVWSKLDEDTLKEVAIRTGGAYVPAQTGTYDLGQVYVDHLAKLQAGEILSEKRKRFRERFQIFAAIGLALYLASLLWRPYRPAAYRVATAALVGLLVVGPARAQTAGDDPAAATGEDATAQPAATEVEVDLTGTPIDWYNRAVDRYRAGDLDQAKALLKHAEEQVQDEPRVPFARGAVYQQVGDLALAEKAYNKAAAAGSAVVTVDARYNLGTVAVAEAKAVLGERPEDATGDARDEGVAHIENAVAHFRAVLRIDPDHAEARHNLELLRLWLKHIRDAWKKKDEQQKDQEQDEDLVTLAQRLLREQRKLRVASREHRDGLKTPARSEAVAELSGSQSALADEAAPLVTKLEETFSQLEQAQAQAAQSGSGQPQPDEEQMAQAKEALLGMADLVRESMSAAADRIAADDLPGADVQQVAAIQGLTSIFGAFCAYPQWLSQMVEVQEDAVKRTAPLAEVAPGGPNASPFPVADLLAYDERFIAAAVDLLLAKVEQSLPQIEGQLDALAQGASQPQPTPTPAPPAGGPTPEEQREQLEKLKESMALARELASQIPPLADEAAVALDTEDYPTALPKEEEVLELLRRIAEPLPKEDPDQGGDQQQDKQDEEKQDKQDEQKQDEQKQDEQDRQDENEQDPQQDPKSEEQQKPQPQPTAMSEEELERLLREAMDRQKEYQEKKKEIQKLLAVPVKVERDW